MAEYILKIASEVQSFLNKSYDYFAKEFCNIDTHRFEIKQEVIAKTSIFVAKKRYAMRIINDGGVKVDKLEVKGLDIVRSNFALAFKTTLKAVIEDILANVPKDKIDERVMTFKNGLSSRPLIELATPTGVKNISKYVDPNANGFDGYIKGTPAHVKASISYNNLLKHFGQEKIYMSISNGDKIKWLYLKNNPLGIAVLAIKGYEDPKEILDFVYQYLDYDKIYLSNFEKKIQSLYDTLKWSMPINLEHSIDKFF